MVPLLVERRRSECRHPIVARVQRLDDPLDCAALAGCVRTLEDHQQRRPELARAHLSAEM